MNNLINNNIIQLSEAKKELEFSLNNYKHLSLHNSQNFKEPDPASPDAVWSERARPSFPDGGRQWIFSFFLQKVMS